MRDNYDRLVLELGVSPRGGARNRGPVVAGGGSDSVQLPRVPQSRHWEAGAARRKSPTNGAASARESRKVGYGRKAKGIGGESPGPLATARLLQKLEGMAEAGQLSTTDAKRLRQLWQLQEKVLTGAAAAGDEEQMLSAFQTILQYIEEPDTVPAGLSDSAPALGASSSGGEGAAAEARKPEPPAERPPPGGARPSSRGDKAAAAAAPSPNKSGAVPAPSAASSKSPPKVPKAPPAPKDAGRASPPPLLQPAPAADPEAEAAFVKVEAMLAHSHTKLFALFKRMDSDLDGAISAPELIAGFKSLGLEISDSEVKAFFRRVEPSGAATTSLKALHKALRPGQAAGKSGGRKPEEAAKEAADAPITSADMLTDGMTEEEVAQMRAEAHLKAGRLPSLSPDEDDEGGGSGRKGKPGDGGFVWTQLEQRIAPDGVEKAPAWQREALSRVQWQVDVNQRKDRREAKQRRELENPNIPTWDKPVRPSKKRLVENELRQMRLQQHEEQEAGEGAAMGGSFTQGRSTRTSVHGGAGASAPAGTLGGAGGDGMPVLENAARQALERIDPEDTSRAFLTWLKGAAGTHDQATTARVNKIAFYEQALQQLQLQRQELEQSLEHAKGSIDRTQRSGKAAQIEGELARQGHRVRRLKADLLEVQSKANTMQTSTQALMHVINSLRITRRRHVQRIGGLDEKERTMDNDSQFLLGSASSAMEERERLRAKHERLKNEAAAWKAMQLKEAAALTETLEELDAETGELNARMQGLDEQSTRIAYANKRKGFTDAQSRNLKYGYLRGQVAGWAAEFERVTSITGVRFGEGKSDAVDKVVSIYSANELRNKSLFKYVTEECVKQAEALQAEVDQDEALAARLEAEQVAGDAKDAQDAASRIVRAEMEEHLSSRLEVADKAVSAILPLVEKLGLYTMDATSVTLPQHLQGKTISSPEVPEFLALLEDSLGALISRASSIVRARAPPPPDPEEEEERIKRGQLPEPEPEVSATLAVLRSCVAQRDLPQGKNASKLLHDDSSERLLPTG